MKLTSPFIYDEPIKEQPTPEVKSEDLGLDFGLFTSDKGVTLYESGTSSISDEISTPKRKKRKKTEVITDTDDNETELDEFQSNKPYMDSYSDMAMVLKGTIAQTNMYINDIKKDIDAIRCSKTLKGKYNYLSLMQGSVSTLIGNTIAAAREVNNITTKCNEFELKRRKELSLVDSKDDDKLIMDTYQAFINTPVGSAGYASIGPNSADMTIRSNNIIGLDLNSSDAQYHNYLNNMSPVQNMMALEGNPDIKQVVVWNKNTGQKYFEVMNTRTQEVVPNVEKLDQMFMEDVTIDERNQIARNINLGQTYPLVVVGSDLMDQY